MTENEIAGIIPTYVSIAEFCNRRLALAIRKVEELHEASYDKTVDRITVTGLEIPKGYAKTYRVCIREVVGDDPIATILDCLFTAGYCDIYDFCDTVLGKVEPSGSAASTEGE